MKKIMRRILKWFVFHVPLFRDYYYFRMVWRHVGILKYIIKRVIPVFSGHIYNPYDKNSTVWGDLLVGKNVKLTQRGGCYIQGGGRLFVGDYTVIAQNCCIMSSNHNLLNHDLSVKKETIIGDHCWIASNSCIMPGVILGPRTVVGAGSIVTKSFPDGFCLIAGNPAKLVKQLPKDAFVPRKFKVEHYGYIPAWRFVHYKKKHLGHLKFHYDLSRVTSNEDLLNDSVVEYDPSFFSPIATECKIS